MLQEKMVGGSSSWSRALLQISPYTFSAIGIAVAIGVSVLGAAWYPFLSIYLYLSVSIFSLDFWFYVHKLSGVFTSLGVVWLVLLLKLPASLPRILLGTYSPLSSFYIFLFVSTSFACVILIKIWICGFIDKGVHSYV